MDVLSEKVVDLVHQQDFFTCFLIVRWATPAALETVACDQITNKLAEIALSLQTILAELFYRAVDEALHDAEGHEEVLEEAVIPVAQIIRIAHVPHTKTEKGQEGRASTLHDPLPFTSADLHNVTGEVCVIVP